MSCFMSICSHVYSNEKIYNFDLLIIKLGFRSKNREKEKQRNELMIIVKRNYNKIYLSNFTTGKEAI